jgi:hypothetical protein
MATLGYEEPICAQLLQKFQNWADPTWGFYVYDTYTRPQGLSDAGGDSEEDKAQEAAGEA